MKKTRENVIFFKGLMKSPLKTGAFFPSSKYLAQVIAGHVNNNEEGYIIEVGAGTGSLTKALLKSGICASKLIILEMQPAFASFLKNKFSEVAVIEGNAKDLNFLLPKNAIGKVHTIVSGIPMVNLGIYEQLSILNACKSVLNNNGRILQFTYRPGSPIPYKKLGFHGKYLGSVIMNLPPASIWEYSFQNMEKEYLFEEKVGICGF